MAENTITPKQRAQFLSEQYAREEKRYHELCDECANLSAQLAEKREQAGSQLSYLHSIGKELLEAMQEVQ
jgi:hypothetical protein